MKLLIFAEIWWNLVKFYFLTNEKWHLWWQNSLEAVYLNKHSISDGKKMVKFEICGKCFDKVYTFWQMRRKVEAKSLETVLAKLYRIIQQQLQWCTAEFRIAKKWPVQGAAEKSGLLKFSVVFSANVWDCNMKFYSFIYWNLLHLTAK